jgi:hypothetical protein
VKGIRSLFEIKAPSALLTQQKTFTTEYVYKNHHFISGDFCCLVLKKRFLCDIITGNFFALSGGINREIPC